MQTVTINSRNRNLSVAYCPQTQPFAGPGGLATLKRAKREAGPHVYTSVFVGGCEVAEDLDTIISKLQWGCDVEIPLVSLANFNEALGINEVA